MCGIAGSITNNTISNSVSSDVLKLLNHRGPDYKKNCYKRKR